MQALSAFMTEDLRTTFERDGVVLLRGLIGKAWRERLEGVIERDLKEPGPYCHNLKSNTGRFHATSRLRETDSDMADYVLKSPLPLLASYFLRSTKVNLLYDQIFVKEPGTDAPSPWHQDLVVWPIRGRQVMSFWLALDPVSAQSGGLEWLAGSHNWGRQFQPITMGGRVYERNPDYEPMPEIDSERDKYRILSWDMEPGDVLAFHALTVHGAKGNTTSNTRRRACTVRYAGDDIVYDVRPSTMTELANPALSDGSPLDSALFPLIRTGEA